MAKRVTEDDKILFNTLYLKLGTYSGVAKETGFSASTVKKYIVPVTVFRSAPSSSKENHS